FFCELLKMATDNVRAKVLWKIPFKSIQEELSSRLKLKKSYNARTMNGNSYLLFTLRKTFIKLNENILKL
ncbi:MAG: hypothetical protein ACP5GH_07215, partial [Nitrososphaeria archaeon]